MAYMDWEKPGAPWFEEGFWWREDRNGELQWLNGRRWVYLEKMTLGKAAKAGIKDAAKMGYYNALYGWQLAQWIKSQI